MSDDPGVPVAAEPDGDFVAWSATAARALLDPQFRRSATRTLLPLAYLLGLVSALAVPIVLSVLLWQSSMVLGIVFAVAVAVPPASRAEIIPFVTTVKLA